MTTATPVRRIRSDAERLTLGYVEYSECDQYVGPHDDIKIPARDVVAMMDRLMLRVQAGVYPKVSWTVDDCWVYRSIKMRWANPTSQFQVEAHAGIGELGFHLRLYPYFYGRTEYPRKNIAYWSVDRRKDASFGGNYGDLSVIRGLGPYQYTSLRFDDPVLDGIPREDRFRSAWPLPELGDDIITIVQGHLQTAGISG